MAHRCSWYYRFYYKGWTNWVTYRDRPRSLLLNSFDSFQQSKSTVYFYTKRKTSSNYSLSTNTKLDSITEWRSWRRLSRGTYHVIKSAESVTRTNRSTRFLLLQWIRYYASCQAALSLFHSKYIWIVWTCLNR